MNPSEFLPGLERKARIEIIPLIDVIFFLLATFVLFTLSLQRITSLETILPVPGREGGEDSTVYLQVSAADTFYWKRGAAGPAELMTTAELRPRLEAYARSAAVPRVFIRSDRTARLGSAVLVLDEVRRAGIRQVSVETMTSPAGS